MTISAGVGTILSRGAGTNPVPSPGTDTFNAVGRVKNIGGPSITKEFFEVSALDSAGGFKEFLSGLRDPGELTFTIQMDPASTEHQGIVADAAASSTLSQRNWRIVWPNSAQADMVGEVSSVVNSTEPNAEITFDVTVRLSGVVTFTWS